MDTYENEEWYDIYVGESLTIEEAKLSYAERKHLSSTAFCGPERSFPAHDAAHVRNGLARLKQSRFGPAIRARIKACLRRKAKKYGIEVSETEEIAVPEDRDEVIKWYLHEMGIEETSQSQANPTKATLDAEEHLEDLETQRLKRRDSAIKFLETPEEIEKNKKAAKPTEFQKGSGKDPVMPK